MMFARVLITVLVLAVSACEKPSHALPSGDPSPESGVPPWLRPGTGWESASATNLRWLLVEAMAGTGSAECEDTTDLPVAPHLTALVAIDGGDLRVGSGEDARRAGRVAARLGLDFAALSPERSRAGLERSVGPEDAILVLVSAHGSEDGVEFGNSTIAAGDLARAFTFGPKGTSPALLFLIDACRTGGAVKLAERLGESGIDAAVVYVGPDVTHVSNTRQVAFTLRATGDDAIARSLVIQFPDLEGKGGLLATIALGVLVHGGAQPVEKFVDDLIAVYSRARTRIDPKLFQAIHVVYTGDEAKVRRTIVRPRPLHQELPRLLRTSRDAPRASPPPGGTPSWPVGTARRLPVSRPTVPCGPRMTPWSAHTRHHVQLSLGPK